jgi:negative regulator of flagellin synthesis FlgM
MQISGNGGARDLANLLLGIQDSDRATNRQAAAPESRQPQQDQVQISQNAKEIQRLTEFASQEDPARADKVAQVQQAIASGTYNVSGQSVADALLRNVLTDTVV